MLLSVIIVNYNVADLVDKCIKSLTLQTKFDKPIDIVVVDNNSSERDIELLPGKYPEVRFIFSKENLGFGRANNLALNESNAKYILFLNPDTLVTEDFISPILEFMQKNPNAGVCGPRLLNEDQTYQNSTGIRMGYLYEISEALMLINIMRYFYRLWLFSKISKTDPVCVSWMSAACMIIPGKILKDINGFRPEYFMNYIDLCERIRSLGYLNYYFPNQKCTHLDHKSQRRDYESLVYNRYYGRMIYAHFHYKKVKRTIIKFIHLTGLLLRIFFTPIIFNGKEKRERLNGYKKALKLYFKWKKSI